MFLKKQYLPLLVAALLPTAACRPSAEGDAPDRSETAPSAVSEALAKYTTVRLTTDVSVLSESERAMIPLLIDAAKAMEEPYWLQAYGDREALLASIDDEDTRRFVAINYGPWDRLADNQPFVEGVGPKPPGANFYPVDMSKEEFEKAAAESEERGERLRGLYTMIRRNDEGELITIPYSEMFREPYERASEALRAASQFAEDEQLARYLSLRSDALLTDDYRESDLAWMDMKNNRLDIVVGPIETYEDQLFGYKAANEAFVLVKDQEWSGRLARYATMLERLQRSLPVEEDYKQETPGMDADLNAYDVLYYAGDANAGSKAIAVNLPNDEQVQLQKGTRRLQLKNAMRAKFTEILVPISNRLTAADQRDDIDFDAFFGNVMFHEVAHGLGIKNTINDRGTVRAALKERASALEEAKADVLGLFMISELTKSGDLEAAALRKNYVTFLASIFRSVRFGGASAHGRANVLQLNFLEQAGAFSYDAASHTYSVDLDAMETGIRELAAAILKFQGDGDYEGLGRFLETYGGIGEELQANLDALGEAGIPVDVVFEQGVAELGL